MNPISNQFVDLLCEDLDSRGMLEERRTRGGTGQSRRARMPGSKNKSKRDLLRKQKADRKLKLQQRPETELAVRGETKPAVRGETGLAVPEKTKPRTTIIPPRSPEGNRPARKPRGPVVDAQPWHEPSEDDEAKKKVEAATESEVKEKKRWKNKDKGSFLSRVYKSSIDKQGLNPVLRRKESFKRLKAKMASPENIESGRKFQSKMDKEGPADWQERSRNTNWEAARDRVRNTPDANPEPSVTNPDTSKDKPSGGVVGNAAPTPNPEVDRFTGKPKGPLDRSDAQEDSDTVTAKVDTNPALKGAEATLNKDLGEPITPRILGEPKEDNPEPIKLKKPIK